MKKDSNSSRQNIIVLTVVVLACLIAFSYLVFSSKNLGHLPVADGGKAVYSFDCRIIDYGYNPDGDMDKLFVQNKSDSLWLHFPPHTAASILNLATKKTVVRVTVFERPPKPGPLENERTYELKSLSSLENSLEVNIRSIPPPPPRPGEYILVEGNSAQLLTDNGEQSKSFIISGRLVSLPPHSAAALVPVLITARKIIVRGHARNPGEGFVNRTGLPLIRAHDITVDGVNYLIE